MNSIQPESIKKTITPDKVLASVSKYQKANKEKMHLKCKRYYERVMADPERSAALKDKQKLYREKAKLKKSLQQ